MIENLMNSIRNKSAGTLLGKMVKFLLIGIFAYVILSTFLTGRYYDWLNILFGYFVCISTLLGGIIWFAKKDIPLTQNFSSTKNGLAEILGCLLIITSLLLIFIITVSLLIIGIP